MSQRGGTADAADSKSALEKGGGSSPSVGTKKSMQGLKDYIDDIKANFLKMPLMYAPTLIAVESVWHMLRGIELYIVYGNLPRATWHDAYDIVAKKYKCGSWMLASKTREEFGDHDTHEAAVELMRRLQEADDIETHMLEENKAKSSSND